MRGRTKDSIQQRLAGYAHQLQYRDLPPAVVHAAKVRIIDTLGALIGGFWGEPCRICRQMAAQVPDAQGATIVGTRTKTTVDFAAFVNGTTARYAEMTDVYHAPGATEGQASVCVAPVLAAAEQVHASGHEFITAIVLSYEIFLRMCDAFHNRGFDNTNFCCLATAAAAGKLWSLDQEHLAHGLSMALVPNNILRQVRTPPLSMWNVVAAGHAGRAGVFAALLARMGMEGPDLPFEGKAGWCEHIARERFSLDVMGGDGAPFKILEPLFKLRPSSGVTISSILAAEKLAPLADLDAVRSITVEIYRRGKEQAGTAAQAWNPDSRETADHSIPYVVAATLMDGSVTLRSFDDAHLSNPRLRTLMSKIAVVENDEFTRSYEHTPQQHHARITVVTAYGDRLEAATGGDQDDQGYPKSDCQIEDKFRALAGVVWDAHRIDRILDDLWNLEREADVAQLLPELMIG